MVVLVIMRFVPNVLLWLAFYTQKFTFKQLSIYTKKIMSNFFKEKKSLNNFVFMINTLYL